MGLAALMLWRRLSGKPVDPVKIESESGCYQYSFFDE
jgi:hypothetical protein